MPQIFKDKRARQTRARLTLTAFLLLSLLLTACGDAGLTQPAAATPAPANLQPQPQNGQVSPDTYTGWAIDAYPDMTQEQMNQAVLRMKQAGANVVWISHANPARSYASEREVGLNPAVLYAFTHFELIQHDDAVQIVAAEKRMLEACKAAGVKAVLSIGYHTQMGAEWNKQHPDDLRRAANGKLWSVVAGADPYASVYSPAFQKDLHDYYLWIDYEFLNPYHDTIQMLNLADEPTGGDYSSWADREFQRRTGYNFAQVGNDRARQRALGQFQSGMIGDFVRLAAGDWLKIRPGMAVTMSFDGGMMREDNGLPGLEELFQAAPSNFVLTWDAYPRDRGTLNIAVTEDDITKLFFLVRNISGYSARYNRKVWLWSAGNSWGLGQQVDQPGTIGDAQANLLYLAQLMNQGGGHLEGLAVWNYNIKTQGLYNYSWNEIKNTATWNADQLFERLSAQFPATRAIMSEPPGQPDFLFLRPAEWQYEQIGQDKPAFIDTQIDFARLDALARSNVASVTASHWPAQVPASWGNLKTVAVLSPPDYLSEGDISGLQRWVNGGGTLLAGLGVVQKLTGQAPSQWTDLPSSQPYGKGRIFVSRQPVYTLFDSAQTGQLQPFWQALLGLDKLEPGYIVRTHSSYLQYQLGKTSSAPAWPTGWEGLSVRRYSQDGTGQLFNQTTWPAWPFERSEFVLGLT